MALRLVRHGNELALLLDAVVLERLGLDECSTFEASIEGRVLTLTVLSGRELSAERFERAHRSIHERYAETFRRLAEE